jgi:sirohydrochlorin cobaltochelatase
MSAERVGLLLIAHGTRDPRGAEEMDELLGLLRARHDGPVEHAWLEDFAEPGVVEAAGRLAAAGVRRVGVVPFLNFAAYHAETDVPNEVDEARATHPELDVVIGDVLGHHPALLKLAAERVGEPHEGEVLVVAASGSSNARANSEVAKAARLLAETTGHRWVEVAFAAVTWPTVEEALQRAARAGGERAVLFSWSLLAGRLSERVSTAAASAADELQIRLRDVGHFGPHPLVADAVMDRFREAFAQ